MAAGKGNIDSISVSLGADLRQLRTDLRAAKTELDKALPTSRTVHVSVGVDTPKNAISELYQDIQGQFAKFQERGGAALRIAPRMVVDPRVMRDFRRDLERNMVQAGRSGQGVRVPIKFNGDTKSFIASIGHIEVPVYGKWAGWSPGGGPPEGAGGGGGGGGGGAPRPTPPGAHRAGTPPAGGGPAPRPARGAPARAGARNQATGGTVVEPHVYVRPGTEVSSSDRYSIQEDPGAFVPRGSPVAGEFVSTPGGARPPTPRQQRQASRRAAMSGAAPPAPRGGLVVPGRGVPAPRGGGPAYVEPPGGRITTANVRGGSTIDELQGEERVAFVSQQRARQTPAAGWAPQAGERTLSPTERRNNAQLRKTLETRAQRIREQQRAARMASPQDVEARAMFARGFHDMDPDLAAAYDIIGDTTYRGSLEDLGAASSLSREAYGTAFHGQTIKSVRRDIGVIRGTKKGDINKVNPVTLAYISALDAAREFQNMQADPNYAVRSGDTSRRGKGGKVGKIGGRNAGRLASVTVDPSHVQAIITARRTGGGRRGTGWKALTEKYGPDAVSVARSRLGANADAPAIEPIVPGQAYGGGAEMYGRGEAPHVAGGQGMFRREPEEERAQPRDLDRPGIDPTSLIGGGVSDLARYGGRTGRGPFKKWMDRQANLALARQQGAGRYRFAEGGLIDYFAGGGVSGRDLRAFFGSRMPETMPRVGSAERGEYETRYLTGMRERSRRAAKPRYQQGGNSDRRWRALANAQFEKDPYCAYCGRRTTKGGTGQDAFQADHLIDQARGGDIYDPENIISSDREHNSFKSGGKKARFLRPGQHMKLLGSGLAEGGKFTTEGGAFRPTGQPESTGSCEGWNPWMGSCQEQKGHKGPHKDTYGDPFRSSPKKKAEGGNVKWSGLASSRGGIKSATMVGERGPEIMVEGYNGKAEVVPSHKVAGFMDGMADGGMYFRQTGGGMPGIRFRGAAGRYTTAGAAAGTATAAGVASSISGGIIRVFVTNWPTGLSSAGAAAGAAFGNPAAANAAAPGVGAPGFTPAGPAGFTPPGTPPTPGAGRVRRGAVDPYARVRAREVALAGEEREGSRAQRIVEGRAEATDVSQRIPVRATSVSFGQIFQQGLGGRGDILARQRRANVALQRAQRAESVYTGLRQAGAEQRAEISDITSGRRQFASTADRDATLAQAREGYQANIRARREAGQVAEQRLGQAETKQAGVLTRGQQLRSQAAGLGGIIIGTSVFSTAMAAFSTATAAATAALDPLVQSMLGWPAAIDKVTSSIRDSITATSGNVRGGTAAAVAPSGISAAYLDRNPALTQTGMNRAAAAAGAQAQDITRAATAGQRGLYTGTGGLFGGNLATEVFGGQPGFLETVAGRLKTNVPKADTQTPANYGFGGMFPNDRATYEALQAQRAGTATSQQRRVQMTPGGRQQFLANYEQALGAPNRQEDVVADLNKNLKSAAEYAGDAASAFELVTNATQDQKDAMIKSAAAVSADAKARAEEFASTGVAVVGPGRQNLQGAQFGRYAEQQARGQLIQDPALLLRASQQQRNAQMFSMRANAAFQRNEDIPAQFALQQRIQPLGRIGAGYDTRNLSDQARKDQADAAKATSSIAESTAQGVAAMEKIVSRVDQPSFEGGIQDQFSAQTGFRTGAGQAGPALTRFRQVVGQAGAIGEQITQKQDTIAQEQATLQAHEYAEQLRLANRSLTDAQDLWAGINGANKQTVGGLQGQNILLDRQNQLLSRRQQRLSFKSEDIGFRTSDLQIQSQNLGFQQSQRQINFNKAIAGFAAPGSTPEERAARIDEAKLEADFAQKQLDLQIQIAAQGREQLKIAKQQAAISREQFGNTVQSQDNQYAITKQEAQRAVADIQASLDLLKEGHTVTIDTAAAEEAIGRLQKAQQVLVDEAQNYLTTGQQIRDAVLADVTNLMAETGKGFNELVGTVQTAWNEAFKSYYDDFYKPVIASLDNLGSYTMNPSSSGKTGEPGYADGVIGSTAGPTQFMAGEAGREHVVVLRNATEGTLMGLTGGGGGGVNIGGVTIVVSGTKSMDEAALADMVVERMAKKLAMLGAR